LPFSALLALLLRSFARSDPSTTWVVPTLFLGRSALPAATDVPPRATNSASSAR
jgi:hypothetical protein